MIDVRLFDATLYGDRRIVNAMMHLLKLSVGSESVDSLIEWQDTKRAQTADGLPRHVTRMWPKRETEVLDGGSIFWVI